MDINLLRSLITLLSFILFIGIGWWAYSSRNRDRLQQYASQPLEDDLPPDSSAVSGNKLRSASRGVPRSKSGSKA